jgi:transcriptional regulator with XRE-family HTH domain
MKDRILEFLKAENKSSAQFAEEIGVQPSGISHILSGRNNPSLDFVIKMLEKYPNISSDWLLFGKGNMYKEQGMQNLFDAAAVAGKKERMEHIVIESDLSKKVNNEETSDIPISKKGVNVEKIVWFFNDNSFLEYFPGSK